MDAIQIASELLEQDQRESSSRRATILSFNRATKRYGSYLEKSRNESEREARLNLLGQELERIVRASCDEIGSKEYDSILETITNKLSGKDEHPTCPHCSSHDWNIVTQDDQGFMGKCDNCGNRFTVDKNTRKVEKAAAGEGSSYQGEEVDPDKVIGDSPAGYRGRGFPQSDDFSAPASKDHPKTEQNIEERADWEAEWNPEDASNRPKKQINPDNTIGDQKGGPTKTFPKGNQADPVSGKNSRWHVIAEMGQPMGVPMGGSSDPLQQIIDAAKQLAAAAQEMQTQKQGLQGDVEDVERLAQQ